MGVGRIITNASNKIYNTFTYELFEADDNPAPIEGLLDSFTITFNGVSPTMNGGRVGLSYYYKFEGAKFTELGDYKIGVREVASSDEINYPVDTGHVFYGVVSVRNELDSNKKPTGRLIATIADYSIDAATGEKVYPDFYNALSATHIEVSNTLTGNMADKNAYFKYRVIINGGTDGDVYQINGQDAEITYDGRTIATSSTYTVGGDNYIYLKDGQTATIGLDGEVEQLPIGVTYSLEEIGAEDYGTFIDNTSENNKVMSAKTTVTVTDAEGNSNVDFAAANITKFVNNKEADVFTGIVMNIWPFALLGIVAIVGVGVLCNSNFNYQKFLRR